MRIGIVLSHLFSLATVIASIGVGCIAFIAFIGSPLTFVDWNKIVLQWTLLIIAAGIYGITWLIDKLSESKYL